jgi:hypothetical protein
MEIPLYKAFPNHSMQTAHLPFTAPTREEIIYSLCVVILIAIAAFGWFSAAHAVFSTPDAVATTRCKQDLTKGTGVNLKQCPRTSTNAQQPRRRQSPILQPSTTPRSKIMSKGFEGLVKGPAVPCVILSNEPESSKELSRRIENLAFLYKDSHTSVPAPEQLASATALIRNNCKGKYSVVFIRNSDGVVLFEGCSDSMEYFAYEGVGERIARMVDHTLKNGRGDGWGWLGCY